MSELVSIITASDPAIRNQSLDRFCQSASKEQLLEECTALDQFRRSSDNLYERVRALFFLYAIYRFHLPQHLTESDMLIPYEGYDHLLRRRFEEAIEVFLQAQSVAGEPSDGIASALAAAYHSLGFQTLADQVRRSVRSVSGNQWMFRIGHPADQPLRIRPALLEKDPVTGLHPILHEATPVRMDLIHSGWSDIFFLGMDYPEGARVLNVSVDLSVRGDDASDAPRPPIDTYFRIIDKPVLRLVSVDLDTSAEITTLDEVFDFAKDYLGLLKAAIIASGIIPPGMEGARQPLTELLARLAGPGKGIELVSQVNGIPKGSRLAVSTNLLASLIAVCMRATGQAHSLTGQLSEDERRVVATRAILGEWLAGSGGGWQDSGGVWPGMKVIQGVEAGKGDPEFGVSRGRLLPDHTILTFDDVSADVREKLQDSLVMVHGGLAQDVGPILEMVTEKYLLRSEAEWDARQEAMQLFDEILELLQQGDVQSIGAATNRTFFGPIRTIVPWATTDFTEKLVDRVKSEFGADFWGFWMMGGMSGGGMGFIFDPTAKAHAQDRLLQIMSETKQELERAIPFAMEPVVYEFAINERGTYADLLAGEQSLMPAGYYAHMMPQLVRRDQHTLTPAERADLDHFSRAIRTAPNLQDVTQSLFDRLLPGAEAQDADRDSLHELLARYGFDREQHEQIRSDMRSGRIGLAQNRLPVSSTIEDVPAEAILDHERSDSGRQAEWTEAGMQALADGAVAMVSMAGGAGSRWTHGSGAVKALNPFSRFAGHHRSFIEVHIAKNRQTARISGTAPVHIVTTSYLTHEPIQTALTQQKNYGYEGPLHLSPGAAIGLRMVPMARDLRFAWEEMPQQLLDEQAQKVQDSLHAALIAWARQAGEASDYTDNVPSQCLHPVGHWYEVPNMLRNGVLERMLQERPQLKYLMIHNIDTLGANLDPAVLGQHILSDKAWTSEVIRRRIDDRGGGLARIDGHDRLIEGLALPREEVEFRLSYYNSATVWLDIDKLLALFELDREALADSKRVAAAVRRMAARMPTYITLKDVKRRWGKGQEDIFPVAQFEKLWGDMTALPDLDTQFVVVPRVRGQQLKEVAQLDGWLRDGSAAAVNALCEWA